MSNIRKPDMWNSISEINTPEKVTKWLRGSIIRSFVGFRRLPSPDERYLRALDELNPTQLRAFLMTMETTKERQAAASDLLGVAGLPLFLGIVALLGIAESGYIAIALYIVILLFYFLIYCYYRLMVAAVQSCLSAARLLPKVVGVSRSQGEDEVSYCG